MNFYGSTNSNDQGQTGDTPFKKPKHQYGRQIYVWLVTTGLLAGSSYLFVTNSRHVDIMEQPSVAMVHTSTEMEEGTEKSDECLMDNDCERIYGKQKPFCSTPESIPHIIAPRFYECYECLRHSHCNDVFKICDMDRNDASCKYFTPDNALPSITEVTHGYNIYKGDPLFTIAEDRVSDPGNTVGSFFDLLYSRDPEEITLEGENYAVPDGFTARPMSNGRKSVTITSTSTTDEYRKATNTTFNFGASGTLWKINLGRSVGISAYKSVFDRSVNSVTTSSSKATTAIYSFGWNTRPNLRISNDAKDSLSMLSRTGKDMVNWDKFFNHFGTHITTEGIFGAWRTVSLAFSESQRETVSKITGSFEKTLKIGIPLIFNIKKSNSGKQEEDSKNEIMTSNSWERETFVGNIDDPIKTPKIIRRLSLTPICEYIPFDEYGHSKKTCYDELLRYCVDELNRVGFKTDACSYPETFECTSNDNCQSGYCYDGKCLEKPWNVGAFDRSCDETCQNLGLRCNDDATPITSNREQLKERLGLAGIRYPMLSSWETSGGLNPAEESAGDGWFMGNGKVDPGCRWSANNRRGLCFCVSYPREFVRECTSNQNCGSGRYCHKGKCIPMPWKAGLPGRSCNQSCKGFGLVCNDNYTPWTGSITLLKERLRLAGIKNPSISDFVSRSGLNPAAYSSRNEWFIGEVPPLCKYIAPNRKGLCFCVPSNAELLASSPP